jgi:hypothetical protein
VPLVFVRARFPDVAILKDQQYLVLLKKRPPDLARFVASRPMGGSHILRAGSLPWGVVAWSPAADQTGSAGTEAGP